MVCQLANTKWGVIGVKYRQVPCTQLPANPAPAPANPFPGVPPPPGALRPTTPRFVGPSAFGTSSANVEVAQIGGIKPIFEGTVLDGWMDASWKVCPHVLEFVEQGKIKHSSTYIFVFCS